MQTWRHPEWDRQTDKLPATMSQQLKRKWLLKTWLQAWATKSIRESSANLPRACEKKRNENLKYMTLLDRGLFQTKLIPEQRPRFKEILRDSREDSRDGKEQWTCKASWNCESIQNKKSQVINKTFRKTFIEPSANLPRCRQYAQNKSCKCHPFINRRGGVLDQPSYIYPSPLKFYRK